jgi:hypothetical protein
MYAECVKDTAGAIWPSPRTHYGVNFVVHRHSDEILTHPHTLPADRKEPK